MNDRELIKAIVDETVDATIRKLKDVGLLKDARDVAYHEITARLQQFFRDGETDPEVTDAISQVESDPYAKIIQLYFRYGYTIEAIAEALDVDVTTVKRNKKRISLQIYEIIERSNDEC